MQFLANDGHPAGRSGHNHNDRYLIRDGGEPARRRSAWSSGLLLAVCWLGWAVPRKRKTFAVLLAVMAIGLGAVLTGCGGSAKKSTNTSTFTVTASAGSAQQTISVSLTLQQ